MSIKPVVHSFFDPQTFTITHVVADPTTKEAAIIDSVLDYDLVTGKTSYECATKVIDLVRVEGYRVQWILETHAHADHVTAAQYLKQKLGGTVAIGERITDVQKVFADVFHLGATFSTDGRQFDHLWKDGETFHVGSMNASVIATPGHTPADVTYVIGDASFVGDTIFMPDYGTARCDFPGGNAETLFDSIRRVYELPEETRLFMCHDYLPEGRAEYYWETTLMEQKKSNVHVSASVDKDTFVEIRRSRDKKMGMPRLIIPSIQINIRAGNVPEPDENGVSYLKVPLNGAFAK